VDRLVEAKLGHVGRVQSLQRCALHALLRHLAHDHRDRISRDEPGKKEVERDRHEKGKDVPEDLLQQIACEG